MADGEDTKPVDASCDCGTAFIGHALMFPLGAN